MLFRKRQRKRTDIAPFATEEDTTARPAQTSAVPIVARQLWNTLKWIVQSWSLPGPPSPPPGHPPPFCQNRPLFHHALLDLENPQFTHQDLINIEDNAYGDYYCKEAEHNMDT